MLTTPSTGAPSLQILGGLAYSTDARWNLRGADCPKSYNARPTTHDPSEIQRLIVSPSEVGQALETAEDRAREARLRYAVYAASDQMYVYVTEPCSYMDGIVMYQPRSGGTLQVNHLLEVKVRDDLRLWEKRTLFLSEPKWCASRRMYERYGIPTIAVYLLVDAIVWIDLSQREVRERTRRAMYPVRHPKTGEETYPMLIPATHRTARVLGMVSEECRRQILQPHYDA